MKTAEEFARMLDGREYKQEIIEKEIQEARESHLVIVFGCSDDRTVLHGAIEGEVMTTDGGTIYLTEEGLFEECACDCIHSRRAREKAKKIQVNWCKGPYVWSYTTDIQHVRFQIIDNQPAENLKFCEGMVFNLSALQ